MSTQEDSFKRELAKRGMILDNQYSDLLPKTKECICGKTLGFSEKICPYCKRSSDKKMIKEELLAEQEISKVFKYALKNPQLSFVDVMEKLRGNSQQKIVLRNG